MKPIFIQCTLGDDRKININVNAITAYSSHPAKHANIKTIVYFNAEKMMEVKEEFEAIQKLLDSDIFAISCVMASPYKSK